MDLYREEKGWTSEFVQKNTPSLVKNVYQLSDIDVFDNTQEALKKSMDYLNRMLYEKPNFTWALRQRAYLYFLTQEFSLSIKDYRVLKNLDDNDETYFQLAKKYEPKSQKSSPLDITSLSQMIRKLCKKKHYLPQALIIMLYDSDIRENRNDHAELVKTILEICNPKWNTEEFSYDPSSAKPSLKIMGKGLKMINMPLHQFVLAQRPSQGMNLALLKTLDIDLLDIKGTGITQLEQFRDLSIRELDVRNTPIRSLKSIDLLPQLKKITVSKRQIVDLSIQHGKRVELKVAEP